MKKFQRGPGEILVTLLAAALAAGIYWGIGKVTCAARWSGSGMDNSYGFFSGCRVQTPNGRWIPDDRVREADLAPVAPAAPRAEVPK